MKRKHLIIAGGMLSLLVLPLLAWNGLVQQGNASAYDILLRLSPARHSAAAKDVVLLAIDDETASRYGPLPLDRAVLAEGLRRVAVSKPNVLVVDMLFPERTGDADDSSLADAFGHFPKVVLACALEAPQEGTPSRWIEPFPELSNRAFALGHVHIEPDRDGIARTLLLTKSTAEVRYWALGFGAFRAAVGTDGPPVEYAHHLLVGNRRVPVAESDGRLMWVHYLGPEGTFQRISFAGVLDGRTPLSTFAGKIVILGVTAQGTGDRVFTPFSAGLGMSGIEVHANILGTLLDGAYLSPMGVISEFLSLLAIVVVLATAAWWRNGRLLAPVAVSGVIAIPVFSYWLLQRGVIVPVASGLAVAIAASLLCFLANTSYMRRRLGEAITGRQDYAFRLQAVAHEIKNPLTAIDASSQLLTERDVPEEKKEEIAQRIHKEAGRLSGVVTTFLDVERISAGVLKLKKQQIELAALVSDVTEQAGLLALKKKMRVEKDLDRVLVAADPELLQYAVYNLVVNAIKYSPDGSLIKVSLRSEHQSACLTVADQGCGIDSAEQKHVFERFYRSSKHRENEKQGSGFGLSLVKEIVVQHGGRIELESEPGRGSRFSVFLPIEERI